MSIAHIKESDFTEWSFIWQQYRQYSGTQPEDASDRETFDRLVAGNPNICGLVIRDTETGKLVGLAHMAILPSIRSRKPIGYMNDLFVDPSTRRMGYARKLISALAEEASKMNCRKMSWASDEDNVAAKGLYDGVASICRLLYSIDLV